jgi:hypothetical protein
MKLDMGTITRWDGDDRDIEPDDEALIFIDDDNEKTIHVRCPGAKDVARKIVEALSSGR